MKTLLKSIIISVALLATSSFNSNAITYTTIADGTWNDVVGVWSTDGGFTACGCTPGTPSVGNDIVVNHNIIMTYAVVINSGSNLTITPAGTLTGGFDLHTWNPGSRIDVFGNITIGKLNVDLTANVNLVGAIALLSGRLQVVNGLVTMDASLINCNGVRVQASGTVTTTNASRLMCSISNFVNDGLITVCGDCCIQTNGNLTNSATGTMLGTGSVNSGGNIKNDNVFDVNINWCATGTDLGMPSAENCPASDAICNAIVLPVELANVAVELNNNDYATMSWETVSEDENDFFEVLKSRDGQNWTKVDVVDGAGTSTERLFYFSDDYDVAIGVTYYRLRQVDFSGRDSYSSVVSVEKKGAGEDLIVFPNPTTNIGVLSVANLTEDGGLVSILNTSGRVVAQQDISRNLEVAQVDISNLMPGIYIVNVEQSGEFRQTKLIVTR